MKIFEVDKVEAIKNVNSLVSKIDFVSDFCKEYNLDVFCVTETWLRSSMPDSALSVFEYAVYRNDLFCLELSTVFVLIYKTLLG